MPRSQAHLFCANTPERGPQLNTHPVCLLTAASKRGISIMEPVPSQAEGIAQGSVVALSNTSETFNYSS